MPLIPQFNTTRLILVVSFSTFVSPSQTVRTLLLLFLVYLLIFLTFGHMGYLLSPSNLWSPLQPMADKHTSSGTKPLP